jgi:putative thioredoxin
MTTSYDVTDFRADVIERSHRVPVLVDFWASWCGPCRVLGPVLERLAGSAGGRWELAKVSTEEFPELASEYAVMSIPNVKLFRGGRVVDEFVGALPEAELRRWLEAAIPSPPSPHLLAAHEHLANGRPGEAIALFERALADSPHDAQAALALAEARLRSDPGSVPALVAAWPEERSDRAEALALMARWRTRRAALPAGAAREHVATTLDAIGAGDWDGALAAAVEALRAQRGWADGAPRELGRAIFLWLGPSHPVSEKHYRAFAGALFV